MKKVTLMQVEVASIQPYIFGANNLQQNIGASELVKLATTQWIIEILDHMQLRHNVHWDRQNDCMVYGVASVFAGTADAEVVYAGSGTALIIFMGNRTSEPKRFIHDLTHRALEKARGMLLLTNAVEVDLDSEVLSEKHHKLRRSAAQRKMDLKPEGPLPGLGVTAACAFTGQPVVGRDKEGRLASRSVCDKIAETGAGNERLHDILPQVRQYYYEFVFNFDQFGEKNESSYLAVVHIDGNQMGERFKKIAKTHPSSSDNESYVRRLRQLSQKIQERSLAALRRVVDTLIYNEKDGKFGEIVPVPRQRDQAYLPFRPIIFGGDDATFVCEGRLGLSLAAAYLQALASERLLPDELDCEWGEPLHSRAGVAVMKSHFPFSRAYELAEDLCQSAKDAIEKRIPDKAGCMLDWHFSTTGLILSLDDIRAREYSAVNGSSLLMRPLWVRPDGTPVASAYWQTWDQFSSILTSFLTSEDWVGHHNKIIALQESLRMGEDAVAHFLEKFNQPLLPQITGMRQMPTSGWHGQHCGYFDSIEALDYYVPLRQPGGQS